MINEDTFATESLNSLTNDDSQMPSFITQGELKRYHHLEHFL
jgi:hypothetical protein